MHATCPHAVRRLTKAGRAPDERGCIPQPIKTLPVTLTRYLCLWCHVHLSIATVSRCATMRTKDSVRKAASARSPGVAEEEERRCFVGQCKKGDCCLEDGHAGSCHDGNMSEEEYEVECITAEKAARGGKRKFLVKWKGWPSEDSTWESSAALEGAKDVSAHAV